MKKLFRAALHAVLPAFLFFTAGCSAARKAGKAAALPVGPDHHATAQAHLNNGNHVQQKCSACYYEVVLY